MTVQIKKLPVYSAARDGLVGVLSLAEVAFTDADFSFDPQSDYRRALAVINASLLQLRSLAVSTLKEIDDGIAGSDMVAQFTETAKEAKKEADLLNRAAHTIEDIADVVGKITAVVTGIAGLPFV